MSSADNRAHQTWLVLQNLHDNFLLGSNVAEYIWLDIEKPKIPTYPSVAEQISILISLEKIGAIKTETRGATIKNAAQVMPLQEKLDGSKGIFFKTLPKFNEIYEEHSKYAKDNVAPAPARHWITRDDNGEFWFEGKNVHFKNSDAKYVQIFIAAFSLAPYGGDISYKAILKLCKWATSTAIQRALSGTQANFFRYVPAIKRVPAHDIPLFEALRNGKEIRFNNKKL